MPVFFKKLRPAGLVGFSAYFLVPAVALLGNEQARLEFEDTLLTANDIIYNQRQRLAIAKGDVTVTRPDVRLVGDRIEYQTEDRSAKGENLRFGQPPLHIAAATIEGTPDSAYLEDAIAYFGEPTPAAINLRASSITYHSGEKLEAKNVTLRVGRVPVFYLPKLTRSLNGGLATEATADAGYSRNLGGFVFLGTRTALHPNFAAGPELGYYARRGFLVGPGIDYSASSPEHEVEGSFRGGYINDRGERGLDRLDQPIRDDRFYTEWRHKQRIGDRVEITGWSDVWSDSEMTRDFRPRFFDENQFPDNFLETVYLGDGYLLSAFGRVAPNDFQIVPERLPEVRFDLPPRLLGGGIYQQSQLSAAALREDNPTGPDPRSDRLDWYYGLNRPFYVTDWLTFTPKAAARVTHYQRALNGRDDYTRILGEVGADLEGSAYGLYDYDNKLWEIDGIRHVVKPRIQYRYTPGADAGRPFIPQVDRQTFATHLEPIDLGQVRHIDDLNEIHTLRYGIDNHFQTRHPTYGSRDLLSLYIANDLRFSRQPGEEFVSNIHTELNFTPIYWLRFDALGRISPQQPDLQELNTGFTITDSRFWSLRFGSEYLEDRLEEYSAFYSLRLNETYRIAAEISYDAVESRFSRQSYTLSQNLWDTWEVHYQAVFRNGSERESPAGFSVSFTYLGF